MKLITITRGARSLITYGEPSNLRVEISPACGRWAAAMTEPCSTTNL